MKLFKPTLLTCALLLATGCTMMPTYERPAAPVEASFPSGIAYDDVPKTTAPLPTWDVFFTNPKVREVIKMALQNNRDLRIAIFNVEKAKAAYGIQRSSLFPNVGAAVNESAGRTPRSISQTGEAITSHTYQANLASTAWEIDLFGRIRSLSEAALQTYLGTEEARWGVKNTLIAEVANAWVNVGAQKELVRLQEVTYKSQIESYKLMLDSYKLGASSLLELEQAKTTVASAQASLAQYQRSLAQARNALNLLVGATVPANLEPTKLEDATTYGAIAPDGLPSEVLLNRPDIKQAENNLKAANANIGAARANFFPRITLTAGIGTSSRHLSDLFDSGTGLWSFAPGISLPIFTGGANLSTLRQAEAERNIMVSTYEKTIQTAFAEVADALATEGTVKRQCEALKRLVNATASAYNLSQSRYKSGLDGFLTVLESQRQMVAAQTTFIGSEQQRLISNIQLYKVLGGGATHEEEGIEQAQAKELAKDEG